MKKLYVLQIILTILLSVMVGCASTIPRPIASTELPTVIANQNSQDKARKTETSIP